MEIANTEKNYNVAPSGSFGQFLSSVHFLLPAALVAIFTIGLAIPVTRKATIWVLAENKPVEIVTFIILLAAGFYGLNFARKLLAGGEKFVYPLFYALFSLGLLFTGFEEIAWGQQLWGFATPEALTGLNMQGETTLHNIKGLHGNTEMLRLLFGIGGLVGILFSKIEKLSKIATPGVLLGWFLIIALHSTLDVYDDFVSVNRYLDAALSQIAELIELLIASAAFLYLYLNSNRLLDDGQSEQGAES